MLLRTVLRLAPIAVLLICGPSSANEVQRFDLAKLVERSELVVIARAHSMGRFAWGRLDFRSATFEVDTTLKGPPLASVEVALDTPIPEASMDCCVLGGAYILYLTPEGDDGRRRGVNGPYSAVRILGRG